MLRYVNYFERFDFGFDDSFGFCFGQIGHIHNNPGWLYGGFFFINIF